MKITQSNNRYVVETKDGKLHILNRKSLVWNLKNHYGVKGETGKKVMRQLDSNGYAEVA